MLIMRVEQSGDGVVVRVTSSVDIERRGCSRTEVFTDTDAAERAVRAYLREYRRGL